MAPQNQFIPVNEPSLDGNEKEYVLEAIRTGWISSEGPFVKEFEHKFSERVNRKYGIAVSNGTAALDIAVEALEIGVGDEVILPTFTIISCIHQIVRSGATPILVDSDPMTWNIDIGQIEDKITKRTKAIMVVHIYGLPVDMDPILNLADKYGLKIIEDAAEQIGQTYKDKLCGSFGDISTFSFYPNKHITTGEGGMIVTNDEKLAERAKSLRNLCFKKQQRFVHDELGWNYRFTNLQAAVGLAQLESLDKHIDKKRNIGKLYTELLSEMDQVQLPLSKTDYAENIYWIYGVVLNDDVSFNAKEAMEKLSNLGVGTRPFFWPMHKQPVFLKMGLFNNVSCPIAENISLKGFYIPSGLAITDDQIHLVSKKIMTILS